MSQDRYRTEREGQHSAIAHRRENDGTVQTVTEHISGVAARCAELASKLGLAEVGEAAGLLHDLGKYSAEFQDYISTGETASLWERVDHSTAGAQWIWRLFKDANELETFAAGQLLGLCIASHHGGLMDCVTPAGDDRFGARMSKAEVLTHLDEVRYKASPDVVARLNELANEGKMAKEVRSALERIGAAEKQRGARSKDGAAFMWGMLARFLFSCLIDADRQDTADFDHPERGQLRANGGYRTWEDLISCLERRLQAFKTTTTLDQIRGEVSAACLHGAERRPGLFGLTVPTGGGKTLSSLRFGLHHARRWGLDRVIYIVPFTTIIDQNASVVREILEPEGTEFCSAVLEHHSNLAQALDGTKARLLAENWDAPVVYTTMARVLEVLFGGGTRNVRRLHQMGRAVLIFDEIQALPVRTVHLFCNALRFLVEQCGSSAVLCTATQPLLGEVDREKGALPIGRENEIIADVGGLFRRLKRVEFQDRRKSGGWGEGEVAGLARELGERLGSCLIIVNTKKQARALLEILRSVHGGPPVYHLSTNMCPAHRLEVLAEMEKRIGRRGGAPEVEGGALCVSTQLIEAGVDVDFGAVIRYLAGVDSIAQGAGRCNRNQKRPEGVVVVVNPKQEDLRHLEDIGAGRDAAARVLDEFRDAPESLGNDPLGPAAIERYFKYYFHDRQMLMDYPVSGERDDSLLNMLARNRLAVEEYTRVHRAQLPRYPWRQSFRSAGGEFKAVDSAGRGVLVPFGERGRRLIGELCAARIEWLPGILRRAQRYAVNVFPWQLKRLQEQGAVHEAQPGTGVWVLGDGYYDSQTGLTLDQGTGPGLLEV